MKYDILHNEHFVWYLRKQIITSNHSFDKLLAQHHVHLICFDCSYWGN